MTLVKLFHLLITDFKVHCLVKVWLAWLSVLNSIPSGMILQLLTIIRYTLISSVFVKGHSISSQNKITPLAIVSTGKLSIS